MFTSLYFMNIYFFQEQVKIHYSNWFNHHITIFTAITKWVSNTLVVFDLLKRILGKRLSLILFSERTRLE